MAIKIIILVIFILSMVGIGVFFRNKNKSVNDFVLGGRNVGPWLTAFAYGTSYFSAVVFVGYAGQFGYKFGISAFWIGIGNAVIGSLLAWLVLAKRTRLMTHHFSATTMPEFFEKRYNSKGLKLISSIIVFVFLIPYSASVYKGLSGLFGQAFGIPFEYCIIGMALLTAVYVVLGGYAATVWSDFVQGIVMIGGIICVVILCLNQKGGILNAVELLGKEGTGLTSVLGPDPINLLGVVILTSLGAWGLPQMIHKFYTIKSKKAVLPAAVISTVFAVIIAGGSYFLGAFGRLFYTTPVVNGKAAPVFDNIIPTMVKTLPDFFIGIVIIMVLSASMSTLSSLVLSSSSTFTLDFLKGFIRPKMKAKSQMVIIRILCLVFILLSVAIALDKNPNNLIPTLMSWSWGALAGSFLGPFIYGLFWKRTTKAAVFAGFFTGIAITVTGFIIFYTGANVELFVGNLKFLNSPVNIGAISILSSLIVVPIVSLLTPKLKKEIVDDAFSSLKEDPDTVSA